MEMIKQDSFSEINKLMEIITSDFKVPLTSISFNIQTIKRILTGVQERDEETLLKKIECIEKKTLEMSRVLEHLIDLARAQTAALPLKKNLTHTHDLVVDVVHLTKEKSADHLVELEDHHLNQYCTIACDKDRLVQVFSNIIHSLAELNPAKGAVKLSTKIKGEVAQFFFKNEHIIMEENLLDTIFDKFCVLTGQSENLATNASKASKAFLGLALSKWIIESHKGSIRIESKENQGTTFTIELPKMELEELKASLA